MLRPSDIRHRLRSKHLTILSSRNNVNCVLNRKPEIEYGSFKNREGVYGDLLLLLDLRYGSPMSPWSGSMVQSFPSLKRERS